MSKSRLEKEPDRQCNVTWPDDFRGAHLSCPHECQYTVRDHPEDHHKCCTAPGGIIDM